MLTGVIQAFKACLKRRYRAAIDLAKHLPRAGGFPSVRSFLQRSSTSTSSSNGKNLQTLFYGRWDEQRVSHSENHSERSNPEHLFRSLWAWWGRRRPSNLGSLETKQRVDCDERHTRSSDGLCDACIRECGSQLTLYFDPLRHPGGNRGQHLCEFALCRRCGARIGASLHLHVYLNEKRPSGAANDNGNAIRNQSTPQVAEEIQARGVQSQGKTAKVKAERRHNYVYLKSFHAD